ncbi:MAG: hypothetical protein ACOYMN_07845 [Roseimicrobium sp.]
MLDVIKSIITLAAYFVLGPMLGQAIAKSRKWQRIVFCFMMVMPCMHPGKITLMIDSWPFYRGHTKGFESNWIEVLGIAIIVASKINRGKLPGWRLMAPGTWLYLLYCISGMLSLYTSYDKIFCLMAMYKFTKAVIMFIAAYHYLRDEEDLRWVLRTIAGNQIFYALLCLKMRMLDGMFQIQGWFEHQNPMAMWVYMSGIPLIGVALDKRTSSGDFMLYMGGFGGAALCIIMSVSRAGLGALAIGALAVLLMAWLSAPSIRLVMVTAGGALGAFVVSMVAMDSLNSRLEEVKESAENNEYTLRDILDMQYEAMLKDSAIGIGWNNFGIMNSRPVGLKYSEILEEWDLSRGFALVEENYYANPLTESLYWLILAETGYPAFVFYMLFNVATLWFTLRAAWRFRGTVWGSFAAAQLPTLVILYGHDKVERILTQTKNLSFWLLMVGLLAAMEVIGNERKKRRKQLRV